MPTDYYIRKQDKLVDINMPKFLMIVITVFLFFVIPAQFISYYKANPEELDKTIAKLTNSEYVAAKTNNNNNNAAPTSQNNNGRVAGVSTSSEESDILGQIFGDVNLQEKSTQYALLGGFFISISFFTILYLLSTEKKTKRHYYAKNKFEYY